jgi:hypothetical protein
MTYDTIPVGTNSVIVFIFHTVSIFAKNQSDDDDSITTALIEVIEHFSRLIEESLFSGASNTVGCGLVRLIHQKFRSAGCEFVVAVVIVPATMVKS